MAGGQGQGRGYLFQSSGQGRMEPCGQRGREYECTKLAQYSEQGGME